jgi:tetratricopeptide (TPR) repeat protein
VPDPGTKRTAGRRIELVATLIPVVAIAIVYAAVRNHGFVWDDGALSTGAVYRDCDLVAILTTAANTFEYLPVRDLTLCFDHAAFKTWPGGFHFTNVFIFMLASALLGSLYRTLFATARLPALSENAPLFSLLATLVFVLHPLQVEPVSFITARNALLALLFVLATLVSYAAFLETSNRRYYLLSIALTVLALFSKATALPLALLVLLLNLYLARNDGIARSLRLASPHLLVTGLAGALHVVIANAHQAIGPSLSLGELLARLPRALFIPQFYLYKFVWPVNQSVEYVLTGVREQMLLFGTSTALLGLACAAILLRDLPRRGMAGILCACLLAALVPISNLLPTYPTVADRYAQIPLVFMTPLVILPAFIWLGRNAVLGLALPLIAWLAWLSIHQVPVWKSDETVFAHAVEMDGRAVDSIKNLGLTRWYRGEEETALEAFKLLEEQLPSDGKYPLYQAWYAVHTKNYGEVDELLRTAERRGVAPYMVHMVKAERYSQQGRTRKAIREYERAGNEAKKRFQRDGTARAYLLTISEALRKLKGRRH